MVELFLEGGPFMWPILLLLLAGLGLVGERIYSLNKSRGDSDSFMISLKGALKSGGSKKALDVCAGHDGPVSNICKARFIFFSSDTRIGSIFEFWKWHKSIRFKRTFNKIN